MMGALEGGVVGTIATRAFVDVASQASIDFAVAIIIGAGASTNLSSSLWATLASGRNKIRALVLLQIATALCAAVPAVLPISGSGLLMMTASVVLARIFWCGVVTVRTTVWAANWERNVRARIAGRIMTMSAIMAAVTGLAFGSVLDADPEAFRWLFPAAAVVGLGGAAIYGRVRVRRHAALKQTERNVSSSGRHRLKDIASPLVQNRSFRKFMGCLFVLGSGNMMVDAPLVLALDSRFATDYLLSIAVVSSIPIITMPFAVGLWSRLLDNVHVVKFRAVHSWAFVLSNALLLIGIAFASMPVVIVAAVARGIGFAGGVLAWNLGHHDFAPEGQAGRYMGTHVTLTGIRGLCAPLLGVLLWTLFGWQAFILPLLLSLAGAIGFLLLSRSWSPEEQNTVSED
jgi:hypothetical protein